MCRARKWLRRCVRKAVRRAALPSHLAGGAPGHGKRLKAEWTGRCGARLEKRVRKVRAERRNKLVKSGECIPRFPSFCARCFVCFVLDPVSVHGPKTKHISHKYPGSTEIGKKAWLFAKLQPGRARKRINAT